MLPGISLKIVIMYLSVFRSSNPAIQRDAVGALSHISEKKDGSVYIFRSGGLAELIRMLGSRVEVRSLFY